MTIHAFVCMWHVIALAHDMLHAPGHAGCRAQEGAAVFVDSGSTLSAANTILRDNIASDSGGAVHVQVLLRALGMHV
jgi:hypothetical protein